MKNLARLLLLSLLSLVLGWFSFHVWGKHVSYSERFNLWNYARLQVDSDPIPVFFFPYTALFSSGQVATTESTGPYEVKRIDVNNRRQFEEWLKTNVYAGNSFGRVIFWPLMAWLAGTVLLASLISPRTSKEQKILRGPEVVPNWKWNFLRLFEKKGFYIETK